MFGEHQAGYEGTRKKVVVSSAEGGKVKQLVSGKKEAGKDEHQLLFVDQAFLEGHCACRISGGNGIEKFCAEALVGDQPCRFKSHQSYPKSPDLKLPAWYIVVRGKGRGGAVGLCEKCVVADSVTDAGLKKILDEDFRSTSGWSTFFEELALSSFAGDNVVAEGVTYREDIASRIKDACTPFKRRQLRLSESPLSKTSAKEMSTDSWVQTGTGYEGRAVPTMEQPDLDTLKSPSSTAGTSINLRKAMGVLQGNMSSLESFLQEQQKDLQSAMSGLGDKLNSLAIVNAALDRRIGHADGFGEEYGVDSAFGGLRFVNEQAGDLITSLGGKDGLAVFEGTKYKEVV
jgi:hypothetical protein